MPITRLRGNRSLTNTDKLRPWRAKERNQLSIKCTKGDRGRWVGSAGLATFLLGLVLLGWARWGESSPAPGLKPGVISNGYFSVTVTNGVTNEFYEIYGLNNLTNPWSLIVTGDVQVTNFSIWMGPDNQRFFKARSGRDWDNDNVLNYKDADPNSTNIGVLTITIDTPTNGQNITQ
jgi:hypothetical protein